MRAGFFAHEAGGFFEAPSDGEELILRRVLNADGRSRAYVNDQPAGVTAVREIGAALVEVHGQHETVGLLDWRTHRASLDAYGGLQPQLSAVASASSKLKAAEARLAELKAQAADADARREEISLNLSELDALDPRADEETELAGERALLGAAEKAIADLADARTQLGGDKLSQKLGAALRAVEHARQRAGQAGAEGDHGVDPGLVPVVRRPPVSVVAAAVTPVTLASLITLARPSGVFTSSTVTKVPLIYMFAPIVKLSGVLVPTTVGQDAFQASLPTTTQVLSLFLK